MGPDRAGEVGRRNRPPNGLGTRRLVGRDQPAATEARVEVEPARDAVDVVRRKRVADLVDVLLRELARIVRLVAVDHVAQPVDGATNALGRRLVAVLRLGTKRVTIGPKAQIPRLVSIRPSMRRS